MNLHQLRKAIEFAHQDEVVVNRALREFFKEAEPTKEEEENAFELFSEWLVFDYRPSSDSPSMLAKYILLNPNALQESDLEILGQILQTQRFGAFEIHRVKRNEWMELEELGTRAMYTIYDKTSTPTIPKKGTLVGRIAKIKEKWIFVGSNPFFLPLTNTDRMKKYLQQTEKLYGSPRDFWQFLSKTGGKMVPPVELKPGDVERKQQELRKFFEKVNEENAFGVSLEAILKEVEGEKRELPSDVLRHLMKQGLKEELVFKYPKFFEDVWNYFPHRILKGKCPVEAYFGLKRKAKRI